jgi:hypothetical protein
MSEFLEMSKNMLIEPFADGLLGIFVGVLSWVVFLAIIVFIGYGVLYLGNTAFMQKLDGYGTVTEKVFIPEHYTTTTEYNVALKIPMVVTHHYDDEWRMSISIDNLSDDVSVSEEFYNKTKINSRIRVKYTEGRLWQSINIKEIY